MPYLKEIVSYINDQVKASLTGPQFQQGAYYGLAVSLPRNFQDNTTDLMPCVVTNDDEEVWVGTDDVFPLIIYHKNNGITTIPDPKGNYGKPGNLLNETANFSMIVYGDRTRLSVTPEELYAGIVGALPVAIPKDKRELWSLRTANISQFIPNFNSISIYQQEYKASTYPLPPNKIFFSINYKIETKYDKSCFDICNL